MIVVAIIGILAAVAIPSYQDYTARAQVSEGLSLTSSFKTTLAEYYADNGDYSGLGNNIATLGGTTAGKYVNSVALEQGSGATIVVVATFKSSGVAAQIQNSEFHIATEDGGKTWVCGALATAAVPTTANTPVPDKLVPGSCK
jgi:type IV pilus assembly protein PilA